MKRSSFNQKWQLGKKASVTDMLSVQGEVTNVTQLYR